MEELSTSTEEYTRFVTRDANTYKVYVYGSDEGGYVNVPGAGSHKLTLFRTDKPVSDNNIQVSTVYLKTFSSRDRIRYALPSAVLLTPGVADAQTWIRELADEPENAGFRFLVEKIGRGEPVGDLFVVSDGGGVVGAIGPLTLLPDNHGSLRLLGLYFGVLRRARRRGLGSRLWRAAMDWAARSGAHYQILQAAFAADEFYRRIPLSQKGFVLRTRT